jgi:hypothetical protein
MCVDHVTATLDLALSASRLDHVTHVVMDMLSHACLRTVKNKEIWENLIDVSTGKVASPELKWSMNDLEVEERDNIIALRSVGQEPADAVAIAEKTAAGKAISGGLVKESDQVNSSWLF